MADMFSVNFFTESILENAFDGSDKDFKVDRTEETLSKHVFLEETTDAITEASENAF